MILVVGLGLVSVYMMLATLNHFAFPGQLAQIEQLRKDVNSQLVQDSSSTNMEDVLGQVTQWNQIIAAIKQYNQYWWSDILYPDKWNDVEFISLHK